MAYLQNDILGLVLNYHELEPIVIVAEMGVAVRFKLSSGDGSVLVNESYWPDFNGMVTLDISDVVSQGLSLDLPDIGQDLQQPSIYNVFNIDINDGEVSGAFTVNGFSKDAASRMSDIDYLRVPSDYVVPLSLPNLCKRSGIRLRISSAGDVDIDGLATDATGLGCVSHFLDLASLDDVVPGVRFAVNLDCGGNVVSSPVYEVLNGKFEQYLFANRYGGFDNIPMDGQLMFVPEMSFESGLYDGSVQQVESDAVYQYSQNSGYMSRKVMELAGELLCSPQIYHWVDGEFRPIVIIESTLQSASQDDLHSFSFKYKYADGSRPKMLSGGKASPVRQIPHLPALMYVIGQSPMVIEHNRSSYPCVTVVDEKKNVVEISVEYLSDSAVRLSWNGDLTGYVYIN